MRTLTLELTSQNFNLIWRSLAALEKNLLQIIADNEDDDDGEKAAFAGNDLVYLRLYKEELEKEAREIFKSENVFNVSDDVIE